MTAGPSLHGFQLARWLLLLALQVLQEFEIYTGLPRGQRQYRFEALITTYELALKDASVLGQIPWSYLLVDEARMLMADVLVLGRLASPSSWPFFLLAIGVGATGFLSRGHTPLPLAPAFTTGTPPQERRERPVPGAGLLAL